MSTENLKKAACVEDLSSLTDDMVKEIDELACNKSNASSMHKKKLLGILKKEINGIRDSYDGDLVKAINALNIVMNAARVKVHHDWLSNKSEFEKALGNIDKKIVNSKIYQKIPANDRKYLEEQKRNDREAKSNDGIPHIALVKSSKP